MFRKCLFLLVLSLRGLSPQVGAYSVEREASILEDCGAVVTATLIASWGEQDAAGVIRTRFSFRTGEVLAGVVPPYFSVLAPGGAFGSEVVRDSRLPLLENGRDYLLLLAIENGAPAFVWAGAGAVPLEQVDLADFRVRAAGIGAGADLTNWEIEPFTYSAVVTDSGLSEQDGFHRFQLMDEGVPLEVIPDISTLPAGITEAEALTALRNALDAWEAVSGLNFKVGTPEVFTQSASTYGSEDPPVIRVQFHDNFNQIANGSTTLGFGGNGYLLFGDPDLQSWGAVVDGEPFNRVTRGYVVLDHVKATLSDPLTLEEVLGHELGHAVSMVHSSEDANETEELLSDALMYFRVHADDRGADPRTWDVDVVRKAYPLNRPPYSFDRTMIAITRPGGAGLANPQVNQLVLEGGDLDGDALTIAILNQTSLNGAFALSGNVLTYTPAGYFGDGDVGNPETGFFDQVEGTFSDGVNGSPLFRVRVVGFRQDSYPAGNVDGIPDSWVSLYFGSKSGSVATNDSDLDGLTELEEWLLQLDPTRADSAFRAGSDSPGTLRFFSRGYGLYGVYSSPDLSTWDLVRLVSRRAAAAGEVTVEDLPEPGADDELFFEVRSVD